MRGFAESPFPPTVDFWNAGIFVVKGTRKWLGRRALVSWQCRTGVARAWANGFACKACWKAVRVSLFAGLAGFGSFLRCRFALSIGSRIGGSGRLILPCCLVRSVRPSSLVTVGCAGCARRPELAAVLYEALLIGTGRYRNCRKQFTWCMGGGDDQEGAGGSMFM